MIFRLDERLVFPDTALAEDDGLLAVGGDLSAERLLLAYHNGIFPWYSDDMPVLWYAPHQRFVLYPAGLRISKSMRHFLRINTHQITFNKNFAGVIKACAAMPRKGQEGTWITADMQKAYINLHKLGKALSVDGWQDDELVGGLYGIPVGRVFCGESMFSLKSNASKLALIALCQTGDYDLIDCQVYTEHLASMGAKMISSDEYLNLLKAGE